MPSNYIKVTRNGHLKFRGSHYGKVKTPLTTMSSSYTETSYAEPIDPPTNP